MYLKEIFKSPTNSTLFNTKYFVCAIQLRPQATNVTLAIEFLLNVETAIYC
jgi:hypothetical protein